MRKGGVMFLSAIFLIMIILIPSAYSLTLKELISRYIFSSSSPQMNVTSFNDYMIDKDNDGLNDTLILEMTINNQAGNFIFVANIADNSGAITNQTNITLNSGTNKVNVSFDTALLSQNQFNYSVKVYNSTSILKFRRDNLTTQVYSGYEQGFRLIGFIGYIEGKSLKISAIINSTANGTFESTLFLRHNNSIISSKNNFSISPSINNLTFAFGNETIKRTHYTGKFNMSSIKIGKKTIRTNFTTNSYSFRDFAASSYISSFNDSGLDTDNDNKYDAIKLRIVVQAFSDDEFSLNIALYSLFNELIEIKNESRQLNSGDNNFDILINGSRIYSKKLNGPFVIKTANLYQNGLLLDSINGAYATGNYNFNDFDAPPLPDFKAEIKASDEFHYGINNVTISFTVSNIGQKHGFNVYHEIFDNYTLLRSNKTSLLRRNSSASSSISFSNFSDFEINLFSDPDDLIEELNESNNAQKVIVKLNKKPELNSINNITINETGKIMLNLSALDPNSDILSYSINSSKFANESNLFYWNTTTMDSGIYLLKAFVSDGYLNDSALFRITVKDMPDIDSDNDGLNDSIDRLIGDSINSTTMNSTILIDDSGNLAKIFNKTSKLKISDGNKTVVEFDFDFLNNKLNLTNISMEKQAGNSTGSFVIRGLRMPSGTTKAVYVDRLNSAVNGVCIKDEAILSIAEISNGCSANNEFAIECDGTLQNSYICTYNESLNKYRIQGLKHSGVMQYSYTKPAESPKTSASSPSASSSGGGGGVACISDWQCSEWSDCVSGFKARTCSDKNQCAFPAKKPEEKEKCTAILTKKDERKPSAAKFEIPINFSSSKKKISSSISSVTGKAVDEVTSDKSYSAIFVLAGLIILAAGYFIIRKHKLD